MKVNNKQIFILYLAITIVIGIILLLGTGYTFEIKESGTYYYLSFYDYSEDWEISFLIVSFVLSLINLVKILIPEKTMRTIFLNLFLVFNIFVMILSLTISYFNKLELKYHNETGV